MKANVALLLPCTVLKFDEMVLFMYVDLCSRFVPHHLLIEHSIAARQECGVYKDVAELNKACRTRTLFRYNQNKMRSVTLPFFIPFISSFFSKLS